MKLTSLILAAMIPGAAVAGPDRLSILLGSEHFGATREFQEFNPGVFLTWEERVFDYSIGAFYNSYEDVSVLGAVGYDYEIAKEFEVGVFAGVAYYPGEGDQFSASVGDVIPVAGVQTRYRNVFAQWIPADGDSVDSVLTFGLTFALNPQN
ncbi:hypothetical protein [Roseovarius sp. 2305UL8-3]|uniref:hypothetical protein n=1 Tax=Roseovarius conchicola TaxID=3121636 RepID=UPI0035287332